MVEVLWHSLFDLRLLYRQAYKAYSRSSDEANVNEGEDQSKDERFERQEA